MNEELIILDEDKAYARRRVAELDKEIQELGPEFYEVFNQSSETWHDNAPFDALRDRQSLLDAERQKLRHILRHSVPAIPAKKKGHVGIGSIVTLESGRTYKVAGDWTPHAGQLLGGHIVVSRKSPLGEALIGKRVGDTVVAGRTTEVVMTVV